MTSANKTKNNKIQLIEAMKKSLGIVTTACKAVGVERTTYYDYYNKDEKFRKEIDDISNMALDFGESALLKQIKEGSVAAIIFYLKCKGKKRGYVERQEIDHSGKIDTGGIVVKAATKEDIETVQKFLNNG